jgi:benzil reductase ((S)-benzoin forming)
MNKNLHFITGGSKGLGAGIAHALAKRGDSVISLSRTPGEPHAKIRDYHVDLSAPLSAHALFDRILVDYPLSDYNQISLINNAGRVEPITQAVNLVDETVLKNIHVNLHSPIVLMTEFLRRTQSHPGSRMILNVSSGVAQRPKASWSVYSAAKAGLEAFSIALQKEHSDQPKTRIVIFNPGIMDTEMQAQIRSSSEKDFPEVSRFIGFKHSGDLRSPKTVGAAVARLVLGTVGADKDVISVDELLALV